MLSELPKDLIKYISNIGNCSIQLATTNIEYKVLFDEENRKKKCKNTMDNIIDTFLVYMKEKDWKKSSIKSFDYYLLHHLRNDQEIESFKRFWINIYGKNKVQVFYNNLDYIRGNTYLETEKAIESYLITYCGEDVN